MYYSACVQLGTEFTSVHYNYNILLLALTLSMFENPCLGEGLVLQSSCKVYKFMGLSRTSNCSLCTLQGQTFAHTVHHVPDPEWVTYTALYSVAPTQSP